MKPIGGYFELEKAGSGGNFPQSEGVMLNTGRNALEYILVSIGCVSKVYIPYYTCEVVLEPFVKLGIDYELYHVNESLELADVISLKRNEYLLYTDYFGVKDEYVKRLADWYGEGLIVDCAQALYAEALPSVKTFYSPRKFVGIPDGGIVYMENGADVKVYPEDDSSDRMSHLYLRKEKGAQAGYDDFKRNSRKLVMLPIRRMSKVTSKIIETVDFNMIRGVRMRNFRQLHEALRWSNRFEIPILDSFECPMVYPYWTTDKGLKSRLIREQVFVATYWPNVFEWMATDLLEYEFADNLIALPCDQRYGEEDMNRIINIIKG